MENYINDFGRGLECSKTNPDLETQLNEVYSRQCRRLADYKVVFERDIDDYHGPMSVEIKENVDFYVERKAQIQDHAQFLVMINSAKYTPVPSKEKLTDQVEKLTRMTENYLPIETIVNQAYASLKRKERAAQAS